MTVRPRSRRFVPRLEPLEARLTPADIPVTNTNDDGSGSLRAAIEQANSTPTIPDRIVFAIPGSDVQTIELASALPALNDPGTVIDGYTQAGASVNTLAVGTNAVLRVELTGGFDVNVGIQIDSDENTVRGLIIGEFTDSGILVNGNNFAIEGNFIGTDASGREAAPNNNGVTVVHGGNGRIGGLTLASRNLISGNTADGICLQDTTGNLVGSNLIGTDATGLAPLGNGDVGVCLEGDADQNAIGDDGAGNVISANAFGGIEANGQADTFIVGNRIGTDARGAVVAGLGNGIVGILLFNVSGGNVARNIVSGNDGDGVVVAGQFGSAYDVNIVRNTIARNDGDGVVLVGLGGDASDNTVAGNTIVNNTGTGVRVGDSDCGCFDNSAGNIITANSIFGNGKLGIDLGSDGVTPNTPQGEENYPVIASVTRSGDSVTVSGTLNSIPDNVFTLEFFASPSPDPSGFGQGLTYLGAVQVQTDADGNATFTFTTSAAGGSFITATSTDACGCSGTSEFSAAVRVPFPPPTPPAPGASPSWVAVGAGAGGPPVVVVLDSATGRMVSAFLAFDATFAGGVSVAVADVNADGTPDVVVGAGAGGLPYVIVVDGTKLTRVLPGGRIAPDALLASFLAYGADFRGGVTVAAADVTGAGRAQVVTGAGPGGAPHVRVWDVVGGQAAERASFLAFSPSFSGGVWVAADVGRVIVGAGPGAGPHVVVIDGRFLGLVGPDGRIADAALQASFFAYPAAFDGGVTVAAGGGLIAVGTATGPTPVIIFGPGGSVSFLAYEPTIDPGVAFLGGVRVALPVAGGRRVLLTGAGPGGGPHLRAWTLTGPLLASLFALDPDFAGGISVA
jgi:parallel beta-helix repeat protein